ncbi:virulence protein RhuM/Fic/DOC family protein [Rothia sp. HMSC067H10]|uniref:virulence protein RhuM/Fic/DOC family protein n=1 Tax=Rothia sp. HMSC067H10 TaxID=1739260 RepID=UPI0008A10C18|nr:virulence protein RhuM/Fic/DOC family protein [Rothia sp. HMSC067H10]OFR96627.1 death-on-curing family protein [Rothia sp. HMSC067H10]
MNEFNNSIIIYQPHADQPAVDVRLEGETVWLSQRQMAELFDVDVRTISEHLSNVFSSGELEKEATIRKFRIVRHEGTRNVTRSVEHYNLDAIISVGYRVKSATATQFRIWATKRLREYLVQGYSINQQRLEQLGQIVEVMARADNHLVAGTGEVLSAYIPSLQTLRDYDEGTLSASESTGNAPVWQLTHADAQAIIARARSEFPQDRLFGLENGDKLKSVVATIYQSFAGQDLYKTTEQKAANLLYLMVKDHPLVDGNKRSAAVLFIEFLSRNNLLFSADGTPLVSNNALAAMTLMVAMSNPKEKDLMVALVERLISPAAH